MTPVPQYPSQLRISGSIKHCRSELVSENDGPSGRGMMSCYCLRIDLKQNWRLNELSKRICLHSAAPSVLPVWQRCVEEIEKSLGLKSRDHVGVCVPTQGATNQIVKL